MKTKRVLSGLAGLNLAAMGLVGLTGSLSMAQEEAAVEQEAAEWVVLLGPETKSLDEHWTTTGNWLLEDGVVSLQPREGEAGWSRWSDYLWAKKEFGDFEIAFEYKVPEGGNSGFYFRVGNKEDPVEQGIEVQIYATPVDKERGALTDHDAGGIIPGLKPHRPASKGPGEWNSMTVRSQGHMLVVMLNGENVNAHDLSGGGRLAERPYKGAIGFQDHALPISLRNIRIRKLTEPGPRPVKPEE